MKKIKGGFTLYDVYKQKKKFKKMYTNNVEKQCLRTMLKNNVYKKF